MRKSISIIITLLAFYNLSFSQWTVNTVPDPKASGYGFVSNPDKILKLNEVFYLDSIVTVLQDSSKAEIAIIMLQSIGDVVPKTFATELFNHWGIGNAETDNGLLILFVMDQRRIEFETGYGTEQILSDAKCYDIQQEFMVPKFKQGDYGQGIIDGVDEVIRILMGRAVEIIPQDNESTSSENSYNNKNNNGVKYKTRNPFQKFYYRNSTLVETYFVAMAFSIFLFFVLFFLSIAKKDYFVRYQTMRIFRTYFWFIAFPIPFVGIYFFVKHITERWRNTPRISAKTGLMMHKLSEEEDDMFLEKGQIAEEAVKSIDYDVWISGEEDDILIQKYKRWFSKYNACPKCKYKTYYKVYDRTITPATYSSSGTGERKHKCTNCGHTKKTRYTIPKKTRSSSSSSGSSSYGGGSSSWGGGSSGGGGAGSSW